MSFNTLYLTVQQTIRGEGRRKEEGGRRKEEGGRRKEEGGRRKEEGGRRKEEGYLTSCIVFFRAL